MRVESLASSQSCRSADADPLCERALRVQSSYPIIHKVGNNANVGIRGFTTFKQNIPVKLLTRVIIEPRPLMNL